VRRGARALGRAILSDPILILDDGCPCVSFKCARPASPRPAQTEHRAASADARLTFIELRTGVGLTSPGSRSATTSSSYTCHERLRRFLRSGRRPRRRNSVVISRPGTARASRVTATRAVFQGRVRCSTPEPPPPLQVAWAPALSDMRQPRRPSGRDASLCHRRGAKSCGHHR
jgi:hypothetical protein